jgi:nucleotidyltransferase substrate binding protein (TIGR01987 family)
MKLQLAPLEKALAQLRRSLDYLRSPMAESDPLLYEQFRAASIQAFEYSYEISVKMIRRQLAQIVANPQELSQMTFADLMRSAADAGLIGSVKDFLTYRDARNQTSHTYDEEIAEDVVKVAEAFCRDAIVLLGELRKRNP